MTNKTNPLGRLNAELKEMVRKGHALRHADGTYQLTPEGKEFYRQNGRNPFEVSGDANAIVIPMDLFESLYLLLEYLLRHSQRPELCLVDQALHCGISTGRVLALSAALGQLIERSGSAPEVRRE